jgi:nucleotide-binding universal stress UspA family protein
MSEFFERILLPLDGTEIANQALPYAVDLARNLDAELVLVRIVPDLRF